MAIDLRLWKKEDLKGACRTRGLTVSGTKAELISRLKATKLNGSSNHSIANNGKAMAATPEARHQNGNSKTLTSKKTRERSMSQVERKRLTEEREAIVLWRKPITTINYSVRELCLTLIDWTKSLLKAKFTLLLLVAIIGAMLAVYNLDGPHQEHLRHVEKYLLWCLWWVGLGVLSSVGLGTGLHTFILYLGPHIAAVTLAAYECGSTDFPEPPYPDSIVCPDGADKSLPMTIWRILAKVRVEAFCWGAGTALGELPPYFMARAHRLSGYDPDEEEDEFDELQEKVQSGEKLGLFDRAKLWIEHFVQRVGFFGILACASIPNPLFDLAGITCGHFLVPFWTFFGATLIGKALIKMHIQKIFVILAFNESLISYVVGQINRVPVLGAMLEGPFKDLLAKQKEKLHQTGAAAGAQPEGNILSSIFECFVLAMVAYFVLSIVNSLAQSYHKRVNKAKKEDPNKRD